MGGEREKSNVEDQKSSASENSNFIMKLISSVCASNIATLTSRVKLQETF